MHVIMDYPKNSCWLRAPAFAMMMVVAALALSNEAVAQDTSAGSLPTLPQLNTPQSAGKIASLKHKLDSIVIDKVSFKNEDIVQVIAFLQKKSKELDHDQQGVNFVVFAPKDCFHVHREVSLVVEHQNLTSLLDQISSQTHLNYSVDESAVYLHPAPDPDDEVFGDRTYTVGEGFFAGASNAEAPSTSDVKKRLIACGVRFPDGATATYSPASGKLVVHNTRSQLDLITELWNYDK